MRRALINFDIVSNAESCGAKGFRIKTTDELLPTLKWAAAPACYGPSGAGRGF